MSATPSPEHARYLAALGISEKPSTVRRKRPSAGHSRKNILVAGESDLFRLRGLLFWRFHTDETREGRTVVVKRGLSTVARIDCATEALAWDCERIVAGIRFKRGA